MKGSMKPCPFIGLLILNVIDKFMFGHEYLQTHKTEKGYVIHAFVAKFINAVIFIACYAVLSLHFSCRL